MSIRVFQTNEKGKIEFTRCELEKLLNETYKEGYNDGEAHAKKDYWTWTSPNATKLPSITYATSASTPTCTSSKEDKTSVSAPSEMKIEGLAKTIDALLESSFNSSALFKNTELNTATKLAENNVFANLAKELRDQ